MLTPLRPYMLELTAERLAKALRAKHIPKLDGLRALSALLVMLYHFGYPIPAGFGVTCFFVISGFLITWLLLEERDKTGGTSLKGFYIRRAFRIFPAFYVYWALSVAYKVIWHRPLLWGQAVSSFFYVCNYYQGLNAYPESGFSRTWSLGVEEQFYLLWPFLFMKLREPRQLLRVLLGIIAAIWVYRLGLYFAGVHEYYLYTAFECRADSIFVGCALAVALRQRLLDAWVGRLCRHWTRLLVTVGCLGLSLVFHHAYGSNYRDPVAHLVEPVLFAILIVQMIGIQWRPLELLDARPVRFLGLISYSTYLYHGVVPIPASAPVVLKLIPAYVMAAGSYLGVEKPFLRLRDVWFSRYRPEPQKKALSTAASA